MYPKRFTLPFCCYVTCSFYFYFLLYCSVTVIFAFTLLLLLLLCRLRLLLLLPYFHCYFYFTLLCFTLLCTFPASSWRTCILIQAPCFLLFHRLGPPDLKVFFLSWRSVALAEKNLSFNVFPPSYPAT